MFVLHRKYFFSACLVMLCMVVLPQFSAGQTLMDLGITNSIRGNLTGNTLEQGKQMKENAKRLQQKQRQNMREVDAAKRNVEKVEKRGVSRLHVMDGNGDGKITLEEMKKYKLGKGGGFDHRKAAQHFSKLDKNGDGFLSAAEIKAAK